MSAGGTRQRVEQICDAALQVDVLERDAFVRAECAGDEAMQRAVGALLAHVETADRFLETPAGALAMRTLGDDVRERSRELIVGALQQPASLREAFLRERCDRPERVSDICRLLAGQETVSLRDPLGPATPVGLRDAPALAGNGLEPMDGASRTDSDAPFTTGEIVADRYRIVAFLGHGGMGRVYRADDLTVGQTVALKFLPPSVERDPQRLESLRAEVRVARQVSHPNVCRVYDVGSAGTRHFLTMEYVDGEDLASLLRRIGRVPPDKALEISRQLCAGLAAVHDRGVIHRDLKPANIMLDGSGHVRVTDFGVAQLADTATPDKRRAGTPSYMAPERFAHGMASAQSDIYALGLVMYEVFTGRRLLDSSSIDQLQRMQRDSAAMRGVIGDAHLDSAVERIVMACVEVAAEHRPASALAIAAALPGSDPLKEALARGETPSPEVVTAARDNGPLSSVRAIAFLLIAVVGSTLTAAWQTKESLFTVLQPRFSGEVLSVKAREMLVRLRPGTTYIALAWSFDVEGAFLQHELQDRNLSRLLTDVRSVRPSAVSFWQRTSPTSLIPRGFPGGLRVSLTDPPDTLPGMTMVRTDLEGRLTYLDAKPAENDDRLPVGAPPPWPQLFREAGLDASRFRPAEPGRIPPAWGDARAAWIGETADRPDVPLRVEAAAYRGVPTFFILVAPWTPRPGVVVPTLLPEQQFARAAAPVVASVVFLAVVLMARRNIKSGRADRRGAARLAAFCAITELAATLLVMAHAADATEVRLVAMALTWPLLVAVVVWLLSIALEPYVRRVWPQALISWNRVLDGRFLDARVARDVLVGAAAAGAMYSLDQFVVPLLGPIVPRGLSTLDWLAASSLKETVAAIANSLVTNMFVAFSLLVLFRMVRMIVRSDAVAIPVFALMGTTLGVLLTSGVVTGPQVIYVFAEWLICGVLFGLMLVRFGVLTVVACLLSFSLLIWVMTIDPSVWYAGPSLVKLVVVLLLAFYSVSTCLAAGRKPQ